jgi:hypothetical protein
VIDIIVDGSKGSIRMRFFIVRMRILAVLYACAAITVAGCGPKHVAVVGKATCNGKPLAGLVISFNPDPDKGNDARVSCMGRIGSDGQYSLISDDGHTVTKGARLGWYKVTLSSPDDAPIPANKKYTDFRKTDLLVEVVADAQPGAYDLEFSK